MAAQALFKWRHFLPEIILLHVRWYCRDPLSYRNLEAMMAERGVAVDHATINRWVLKFAPALDKRLRLPLSLTHASWRVDETDIDMKGEWQDLDRAVASAGKTLDFMLRAKRDGKAVARLCRKVLQAEHTQAPRVMTVDQNAADPVAMAQLNADETSAAETKLWQSQDLHHVIEQDHRNIKRSVKPLMGCQSCNSASRTLSGMEAMSLIRKGQVQGSSQGDSVSQMKCIEALFGVSV